MTIPGKKDAEVLLAKCDIGSLLIESRPSVDEERAGLERFAEWMEGENEGEMRCECK